GAAVSPLITFGSQYVEKSGDEEVILQPETPWTIRLDMRQVLKGFEEQGFYTNVKGEKIYKDDFKAVYIAGNTLPMTWDFDNLRNRPELELKDPDGDGIYETTLILNSKADLKKIDTVWQLSRDISAFPQYRSPHVLADAIYNMSLEEMEKAVETDSTLRTGAEWAGVWTRDVSYSIILSMAHMQPKVAMNSLRRKVNGRKRIIQDTGTGGAWPVSTDRMIWAVAAWEIYLVTGDKDWLKEVYEVIKLSLEDDYKVAYDAGTGLVKGESSFLDWREQTYPKWMEPADIFESLCLGTNAVHYQANVVAAKMAALLDDATAKGHFEAKAAAIKKGINGHLWLEDKGYYGQYLYGRIHKILSPRSEALGEALAVLFDIAGEERQGRVVASTPVVDFGIPCIYPQIPGIPPYHNNGIWPFVQTYWTWAAAKAGNEQSVLESMAAIYRPSALFLTNKENFVAENGDFSGTVINSSNMLWSLSGNISLVHKVLFGIRFLENGSTFEPFVPSALKGVRSLSNFKYRGAVMDIEMEGYGDEIRSMTLDGVEVKDRFISGDLQGKHNVKIVLSNSFRKPGPVNKVANKFSPAVPFDTITSISVANSPSRYHWSKINGAVSYQVLLNGSVVANTTNPVHEIPDNSSGHVQIIAIDKDDLGSFASEPGMIGIPSIREFEAERFAPRAINDHKGFSGDGSIEIARNRNREVIFEIDIKRTGVYAISFLYANGNGPVNTENKCATRSLYAGDDLVGAVVFPQRGTNEWSAWGRSNHLKVRLKEGKNTLVLRLEDWNENMNGDIDQAMIDLLKVEYLGE
ncbi:MAG TPA: hypothetical protein VK907_05375, partial [Phnomibacter sp.]|nr:hypothetical protein [Phnomibacter sp.]